MMRKWIIPVAMISLGLNLMFGYQNCAQVDPSFVYDDNSQNKALDKTNNTEIATSFVKISEIKIQQSKVTRYQRSVRYQMQADFRVQYTNDYIGAKPDLISQDIYLLDAKKRQVSKLDKTQIDFYEKECVEAVNADLVSYFDCKYTLSTKQKLNVSPIKFKKSQYRVGNENGYLGIHMVNNQMVLAKKNYMLMANYIDKYVVQPKRRIVKKKAKLPKISKKKKVRKKIVKRIRPIKKKSKKQIADKKILQGVYCHIKVLNPPHLELLSDVKKAGTYYEDTANCREAAVRLSKRYCDRSLMGEIDYSLSIKDKTNKGTKVLEKLADSIECASDS